MGGAGMASPDMDVFTRTPLQYIEYHWDHPFVRRRFGVRFPPCPHPIDELLAGPLCPRRLSAIRLAADAGMAQPTRSFCITFLDCMNSYGTQVFLPFSDYRVRLNVLFIVDPLLLLLLALWALIMESGAPSRIGLLL